jgi:hypothetical protein
LNIVCSMLLHAGLLYALSSVMCFTQMFAVIVSLLYKIFDFFYF